MVSSVDPVTHDRQNGVQAPVFDYLIIFANFLKVRTIILLLR